MGKGLTAKQRLVLDAVAKDQFLSQRFYFTGGTALATYYLHHRISDDIDLFSQNRFDELQIIEFVNRLKSSQSLQSKLSRIEDRLEFQLTFPDGESLITDFVYYPYQRLERGESYEGFPVDSLFDIAINKLLVVNQRTNPKDFVDLYFLLKTYTVWDLIPGVERKFGSEIDLFLLAADLLKPEDFDVLPRMLKPLTLKELKSFFRKLARSLSKEVAA